MIRIEVDDVREPFLSTDFAKSFHLVKDYKNRAVEYNCWDLVSNLRSIETNHFCKAVEVVHGDKSVIGVDVYLKYEFDWDKEVSFDKELFISDMLKCFDSYLLCIGEFNSYITAKQKSTKILNHEHEGAIKLIRDFKISVLTNNLY